jgi:hypothetical protein
MHGGLVDWDTFGLFESLLERFEELAGRARDVRSSGPPGTEQTHAAATGFLLFSPVEDWGREQHDFITRRLEGELSLPALDWYEEGAPAIQMFACLALGALLGKYAAGEIDERDFLLGDAHLASFLLEQDQAICARYDQSRRS